MNGNQKTDSYAIASIVLAMAGLLSGVWLLGLLGVAAGEKFRRLDKTAGGRLKGKTLAAAGTILGIIPFFVSIISVGIRELCR